MADEKTQTGTGSKTGESGNGKNEGFEQAKSDSLSPADKHKNYLALLEKLHNEP